MKLKKRSPKSSAHLLLSAHHGTTLVELMVAVTLLTIISLGLVGVFANIGKAIQFSKSRALASNLAQEKMQILKQQPFDRLLVTTTSLSIPGLTPNIPYDPGYYPPETLLEGGIQYLRYTYVQVADENSGALVFLGAVPDTGMKAITVTVVWSQGTTLKSVQVRNIAGNINTTMTNAILTGIITDSGSGTGISGALVTMAENVGFQDTTNGGGNYLINLVPGSYTFNVIAHGYFPYSTTVSVAPNATLTMPTIPLSLMGTGTIRGTVWKNDHLVISSVVGSTINAAGFCQEYVEVFNPTTFTWTINGNIDLKYQRFGNPMPTPITMNYNVNSVGPSSYYLFANTSPVRAAGVSIAADAVYQPANPGFPDLIKIVAPDPCGVGGGNADGVGIAWTANGAWLDKVGWAQNPRNPPLVEGFPLPANWPLPNGLKDGEQFVRRTSTAGISASLGRAYDTDNNVANLVDFSSLLFSPNNSSIVQTVVSGTPANGAFVTASDGLSQVTVANLVGLIPYAEFQLPSVATGTWIVFVASSNLFMQVSSVTVTPNTTTYMTNSNTIPAWPFSGQYATILSSAATQGYVTGWVKDVSGSPILSGINVYANSYYAPANTTNGIYLLPAPPGTYDITANQNNLNSQYVAETSPTVVVTLGQVTSNVNFILSQGGRIRGFCTRDGTNALQGIVFTASDVNDIAKDSEISGGDGRFLLTNLSTGIYTVMPVLDTGEIASPSSATVTVTVGATVLAGTFTITGAFGTIAGNVTASGQPIRSGVTLLASTTTLAGGPPILSSNTLTGASYYLTNSYEDGTYSLVVRGSTSTTYNVFAYYPNFNGSVSSTTIKSTIGVSATPGNTTSGVNFAF